MTLILILQTVEPMLFPRYFVGSSLDPFFFHKVFKRELPHASGFRGSESYDEWFDSWLDDCIFWADMVQFRYSLCCFWVVSLGVRSHLSWEESRHLDVSSNFLEGLKKRWCVFAFKFVRCCWFWWNRRVEVSFKVIDKLLLITWVVYRFKYFSLLFGSVK